MSIDDVLLRSRLREDQMWTTFTHCFLGAYDPEKRVILFGLYANGFENSLEYLVDISTEKIVQLVSEYDLNMAQLDADQQQTVLEIASKKYIDTLDQLIHDQKMDVKKSQIDADDLEFDAKEAALQADQAALETLKEKLLQAKTKAESDIATLEARIAEEEITSEYVDVEILQKALDVRKTELQTIEAGLRGVGIQMDITETAIQTVELNTSQIDVQQKIDLVPVELKELEAGEKGLDADIMRSDTGKGLLDSEIAGIENRAWKAQIDKSSKKTDTNLLEADLSKIKVDTAMIDVDIQKLEVRTAQEDAKRVELETDTALVAVKVAEMQLAADKVDVQLMEIESDIALLDVRMLREDLLAVDKEISETRKDNLKYEISLKKQAQIDSIAKQIEIIKAKIKASETYQVIETDVQASRLTKQTADQNYRVTMALLNDELSIHRSEVKIASFAEDIVLAEEQEGYQQKEDIEHIKIPESQVDAAYTKKNAAIDAAETMATANIINTLTHEIGAA